MHFILTIAQIKVVNICFDPSVRNTLFLIPFLLFSSLSSAQQSSAEKASLDLLNASLSGDLHEILVAIKDSADVNYQTMDGHSALMIASQEGQTDIIRVLLYNGANPDLKAEDSCSAVFFSVANNHIQATETLIRNGAGINIRDIWGNTPLFYASLFGYDTLVDLLLYYESDPNIVNLDNISPLMGAVSSGYTGIAENLLLHNADINAQDMENYTPLMYSLKDCNKHMIQLLISYKASLDQKNTHGYNPVSIAAITGCKDFFSDISNAFPGFHEKLKNEKSLYLKAIRYNQYELAEYLLSLGMKRKKNPVINSMIFSYASLFNRDDFFSGPSFCIEDGNNLMQIEAGYMFRFSAKRILTEGMNNTYYQLWEKRNNLYLLFKKNYHILTKRKSDILAGVGIQAIHSFGSYRAFGEKASEMTLLSPHIETTVSFKNLRFILGYQYTDFRLHQISPHWVKLGLSYRFSLYHPHKHNKTILIQ